MNKEYIEILKFIISGLAIYIFIWVFVSSMVFTGTFFDKYKCEDFKEMGYDVKSNVKVGFLLIPYNRCVVKYEGIYVPHYKFPEVIN